MAQIDRVTVAVLTYRRPEGLQSALKSIRTKIAELPSPNLVCEVIVVDNDEIPSAQTVVDSTDWALVRYVHEATAGVANARNRALDEAVGNILIFVDDDERAGPGWPLGLLETMRSTEAALVGGPVRTEFSSEPPLWARPIGFFDRPEPPDGIALPWLRSGNLAINLDAVRLANLRFDPAFNGGGEDVRFSVSARRVGLGLRWSATTVVFEDVPASRLTERWVIDRAFGATSNYVRANAPLGAPLATRCIAVAGVRILAGGALTATGWLRRDDIERMRGRITLARGLGAFHGVSGALRR